MFFAIVIGLDRTSATALLVRVLAPASDEAVRESMPCDVETGQREELALEDETEAEPRRLRE